jgi:hemin uptake protein HemP
MSPRLHSPTSDKPQHGAAPPPERRLQSDQLLQGARRVVIEHGEASYTLLLTRNDKLILVK